MIQKFKCTLELQDNKTVLVDYLSKEILIQWAKLKTFILKGMKNVPISGTEKGYCVVNDWQTQYVVFGELLSQAHKMANPVG